jgi:DHA2 family lincomycin resistance protein-like MFS transporter
MMPLLMTTVLTIVPMASRGRMMGRISIVMSVAPAIGPAISGLILFVLPWRGLFWVMLPIALVMLVIGIMRVPNVSETEKVPLDVLSVVLSAVGFSGVVYGLSTLGAPAGDAPLFPVWLPLVIGGVFLAGFILRQLQLQRKDAAFLDLRSFKSGTFTASIVMLAVSMIALFGTFFVLPIYLHSVLKQEPLVTGLLLLPGGLIMGLLGPLVGRLYDRFGPKPLVIPGSIVITLALSGFTLFNTQTPLFVVLGLYVVLTLGLAFLFTPLFTAATGALPPHLYSHGSATIATIQQVAGAAGIAVFVALLTVGVTGAGGDSYATATPAQLTEGVRLAFIGGAIASVAAIVVAFFVRKPVEPELADIGEHGHIG